MYRYKDIAFRPLEFADLEPLRLLHNDHDTLLQLGSVELFSAPEQEDWFERVSRNPSVRRYALVMADTNELIGLLRLQNIDIHNRNLEVGLDIMPQWRGKGYGRKSYAMVLEYLFLHFNMNLVWLRVGDFNPGAMSLYHKIGFLETGRFPGFLYRHGRHYDYVLMSMLRDDYLQARKPGNTKE